MGGPRNLQVVCHHQSEELRMKVSSFQVTSHGLGAVSFQLIASVEVLAVTSGLNKNAAPISNSRSTQRQAIQGYFLNNKHSVGSLCIN